MKTSKELSDQFYKDLMDLGISKWKDKKGYIDLVIEEGYNPSSGQSDFRFRVPVEIWKNKMEHFSNIIERDWIGGGVPMSLDWNTATIWLKLG